MNRSRDHHYVPQFYLRGFTDTGAEDGTVWLLNKRTKTCKPAGIAVVGMETDYNTVYVDGVRSDEVERVFADLEGSFATVLNEIRSSGRLPDDVEKLDWLLYFVASSLSRVRQSRDAHKELVLSVVQSIVDHRFPESFKVHLKNENYLVAEGLRAMVPVRQRLSVYSWALQVLEDECPNLVTSDVPVMSGVFRGQLLAFPLSKRLMLFAFRERGEHQGVAFLEPRAMGRKTARACNGMMLCSARQFVYSPTDLPVDLQAQYIDFAREFLAGK